MSHYDDNDPTTTISAGDDDTTMPPLGVRIEHAVMTQERGPVSLVTQVIAVDVTPAIVAGQKDTRTRLTIKNISPETVYISGGPATAVPAAGYPVPTGAIIELDGSPAVYASCPTGVASLAILAQYRDG